MRHICRDFLLTDLSKTGVSRQNHSQFEFLPFSQCKPCEGSGELGVRSFSVAAQVNPKNADPFTDLFTAQNLRK
jgi:hypothetical protein